MQKKPTRRVRLSRKYILMLLACFAFFTFEQELIAGVTGKIVGTIKDSETGEFLPVANILILGTKTHCEKSQIRRVGSEKVAQKGRFNPYSILLPRMF